MTSNAFTFRGIALRRKPDEDVFARALTGDEVAFSEVYRRYHPRIFGFCLARTLDPHAAADAAQDVFVRLLKAEPGSISSPKAWLFTVARNVITDRFREQGGPSAAVPAADDSVAWEALPHSADAADVAVSRETAGNVYLALRRMRPRYRTALVLREIHGESSAAMADALDTTPGAIDTLVSRARDSFGKIYAEVAGFPAECRTAVELAYRRTGSGIDDAENARLETHLEDCPACRLEAARAEQPSGLAAFLPFLASAGPGGRSLFAKAIAALQGAPAQVGLQIASPSASHWPTTLKAGTLALAIGLTVVMPPLAYHEAQVLKQQIDLPTVGPSMSWREGWLKPIGLSGQPSSNMRATAGGPRRATATAMIFGSQQASAHDSSCLNIASLQVGHDASLACVEPKTASVAAGADHAGSAHAASTSSQTSHSSGGSHSVTAPSAEAHSAPASGSGSHAVSSGSGTDHGGSHSGSDSGSMH